MRALTILLIFFSIAAFAAGPEPEATSLTGKPLFAPELSPQQLKELDQKLSSARADWEKHPESADAWIWYGRRTAYMGRYREAIDIFTRAIAKFPEDARLYRHRGHRYLTVRRIPDAISDFERAAQLVERKPDEIEPDGLPNAKNIPLSTLKTNIYYHLGLAFYLQQNYEKAAQAYEKCLSFSKNDDMICATSHWLYMTLRRAGKQKEAAVVLEQIRPGMEIIEDFEYHQLLLMYRGDKKPEEILAKAEGDLSNATVGYGIANWYFYNKNTARAMELFRQITSGKEWASFGYLAAESELAR